MIVIIKNNALELLFQQFLESFGYVDDFLTQNNPIICGYCRIQSLGNDNFSFESVNYKTNTGALNRPTGIQIDNSLTKFEKQIDNESSIIWRLTIASVHVTRHY